MAELSIIIVNWNGEKFLPTCLESIVQNPPGVPYEIIVIDNASSDKSVELLKSQEMRAVLGDTDFKLIESAENLGFGKANNLVIEQIDSPYVFLLNPDTIVRAGAIDTLLGTLRSDKTIGAVAPKLFNADGTLQYNVWGFPPTPLTLIADGLKLHKFLPRKFVGKWLYRNHWDYNERTAVPMFSGAAILAKREMIDQVGAFDTDFFMYSEDFEWCLRMNRMGWKTVFEPAAEIVHIGGESSAQRWGAEITRLKEEEAFIIFQKKCLPRYLLRLNLITRIFVLTAFYIKRSITREDNSLITKVIKLQYTSLRSM